MVMSNSLRSVRRTVRNRLCVEGLCVLKESVVVKNGGLGGYKREGVFEWE